MVWLLAFAYVAGVFALFALAVVLVESVRFLLSRGRGPKA